MFAISAEFDTPPAANCGTAEMKAHSPLEKRQTHAYKIISDYEY
jgi:hypothetical protein